MEETTTGTVADLDGLTREQLAAMAEQLLQEKEKLQQENAALRKNTKECRDLIQAIRNPELRYAALLKENTAPLTKEERELWKTIRQSLENLFDSHFRSEFTSATTALFKWTYARFLVIKAHSDELEKHTEDSVTSSGQNALQRVRFQQDQRVLALLQEILEKASASTETDGTRNVAGSPSDIVQGGEEETVDPPVELLQETPYNLGTSVKTLPINLHRMLSDTDPQYACVGWYQTADGQWAFRIYDKAALLALLKRSGTRLVNKKTGLQKSDREIYNAFTTYISGEQHLGFYSVGENEMTWRHPMFVEDNEDLAKQIKLAWKKKLKNAGSQADNDAADAAGVVAS